MFLPVFCWLPTETFVVGPLFGNSDCHIAVWMDNQQKVGRASLAEWTISKKPSRKKRLGGHLRLNGCPHAVWTVVPQKTGLERTFGTITSKKPSQQKRFGGFFEGSDGFNRLNGRGLHPRFPIRHCFRQLVVT
jgi:hypothetical protein